MDGTLLDTMPAHLQAWEMTAEHFGFPFNQHWLHSLGGMPSYKIAAEVNTKYSLSLDPAQVSRFKMETFASIDQPGQPIECTLEVLKQFVGKKKLAIGTGSQRESALRLLTMTNLLQHMDTVVTATDVERHKPNPDTFLRAAEQMGVIASSCVVFEDTALGLEAAHAANMDCFLVEDGQLVFYPCPNNKEPH
ncbi:beta-phosphoglucomutase family hydrolase [Vibrio sp. JPW-9-11-11]|nr:beta-phosphoglucomutase family hydrolase [Vibrio sp. JPW-9-11-11]